MEYFWKKAGFTAKKRAVYPFAGFWELPGGHVEYGETVEEALKREMKEELGVSVKIKELFGIYSSPKRDPRYITIPLGIRTKIDSSKNLFQIEESGII